MSSPASSTNPAFAPAQPGEVFAATTQRPWTTPARRIGIVLLSLVLGLICLSSPRVPKAVDVETAADASWSAVLGYAHQHGLGYGTDIVFTYGPLGFLATPFVSGDQVGLRLVTDALLSLTAGFAIALVAWKVRVLWRLLLLGTSFFLLGNISPRTDLLIELNLLLWGLLSLLESGRALRLELCLFLLLALFAALVKMNLLILALLSVCWLTLDLLARGERRLGAGVALLFISGFLVCWMGLGQAPSHLFLFLERALITSRGYNQAMGFEGAMELRWRGIFVGFAASGIILMRSFGFFSAVPHLRWRRVLLASWLSGTLLLVWKHGFVRTDLYHTGFYFGFVPLLALALEAVPVCARGAAFWARAAAILCWFVSLITTQSIVLPADLRASLVQPVLGLRQNLASVVMPTSHIRAVKEAMAEQRNRAQLPGLEKLVGPAGVDVFGREQTAALFNHLNYRPRPVFQSYAAYNSQLMELNEDYYRSAEAPEYVLFRMVPMERRFPPLEDSLILRHLLINYQPTATDGDFLLLKQNGRSRPELKLLAQGFVKPGEELSLTNYMGMDLWVDFNLRPSLLGRVRELFYQPAKVRLALWYGGPEVKKPRRFRAPMPMLSAGFLISPVLLNTDDVLKLYRGDEFVRPHGCAVELNPGTERLWNDSIPYRLYKFESKLGRCGTPVLLSFGGAGSGTNAPRVN